MAEKGLQSGKKGPVGIQYTSTHTRKKTKASLWIYLSLTIIWLGRTDIDKKETLFSSIDLRESEWKKISLEFLHRYYQNQPIN